MGTNKEKLEWTETLTERLERLNADRDEGNGKL